MIFAKYLYPLPPAACKFNMLLHDAYSICWSNLNACGHLLSCQPQHHVPHRFSGQWSTHRDISPASLLSLLSARSLGAIHFPACACHDLMPRGNQTRCRQAQEGDGRLAPLPQRPRRIRLGDGEFSVFAVLLSMLCHGERRPCT